MQNAQHSALSPQHLNGWVSKFFVHYNGRKLGPYYARCWKENNKQKREYIKPADLERVREACQRYRDHCKAISKTTRDFSTLTGNLNYVARMAKRITRGFLRPEDYIFIEKIQDNGFHTPGRPKLRRAIFASSPEPKAQSQTFMYPLSANPKIQRSAPRRILKPLRARLLKFMQDKLPKETEVEKCNRWAREMKARPRPKPNIERALPSWITKEQIAADIQRVREAFSNRK